MKNTLLFIGLNGGLVSANTQEAVSSLFNIDTDERAGAYAEEQIHINVSPEKVYNILTSVNEWSQWQEDVKSSVMEGEPEEGKSFEWKAAGAKITSQFHTLTPGRAVGWSGKMLWITAVHNWELLENVGSTIVKVKESMNGVGAGLMRNKLKAGMRKNLLELKNRAENNYRSPVLKSSRLISEEVVINAGKEEVWSTLTEISKWNNWNPFFTEASGKLIKGKKLKVTMNMGAGIIRFRPEVLEVVQGEKLSWVGHMLFPGIMDGTHDFILEETADGKVRFIQQEKFRGLLSGLMLRFSGEKTKENWRRMNVALKKEVEGK